MTLPHNKINGIFKVMKQAKLFEGLEIGSKEKSKLRAQLDPRSSHGGHESQGKRKSTRPFSPKSSLHIVLASKRAKGLWSLKHRKNQAAIAAMVYVYAARFKVRVYRFANVGDHIHLHVKASERKALADYLRVLAGRIAVTVSGARKHVKRIGKFWDHLCWSRLVKWGKDFHVVQRYVMANELEAVNRSYRKMVLTNKWHLPMEYWSFKPK